MGLTFVLLLVAFFPTSVLSGAEGDALVALTVSLKAAETQLADWNLYQVSPCTWSSVRCDANEHVISVSLTSMYFTGSLIPKIAVLKSLTTFILQGSYISGEIPKEFGNLSSLTNLNLENNCLSFEIPSTLGNLQKLQFLRVDSNNLIGQVPEHLFQLTQHKDFTLVENWAYPWSCCRRRHFLCYRGCFMVRLIKSKHRGYKREIFVDVAGEVDRRISFGQLRRLSWRELQLATDSFSEKNVLGQGGFGKVYKRVLADNTKVAVKRLTDFERPSGDAAFQHEVELICVAVHKNLLLDSVQLLQNAFGVPLHAESKCGSSPKRYCLYTPISGLMDGVLPTPLFIYAEIKPRDKILDWATRKRVALGTARELEYLHEHCNPKIIHREVKAANVLLDDDFEAAVGDFGLSKLVDVRKTNVTTQVRGTMGHMAPEYLSTGKSSERTDVFGYGIMLLMLVTGQRVFDFSHLEDEDDVLLLDHVKKLERAKRLADIVYNNLQNYNIKELETMIQVTLLCTQSSPEERPAMSEVVRMLEGEGLAQTRDEWQNIEVSRRQEHERLQRRFDWGEDSVYNQEAIELSGGRRTIRLQIYIRRKCTA